MRLGKLFIYVELDWSMWSIGVGFDFSYSEVIFYFLPLHIIIGKSSTYN